MQPLSPKSGTPWELHPAGAGRGFGTAARERKRLYGILQYRHYWSRHRLRHCSCFKHKVLDMQLREASDESTQFLSESPT